MWFIIFLFHNEILLFSSNHQLITPPRKSRDIWAWVITVEKALDILGANRPSSLLVDVGANVGTICISAVKRRFFEKAIAIEPEPFNFGILVSNVHLNNLADKITAYNLALGSHDSKELSFELSDTNYGDHRTRCLTT